ncbi:MAG: hypothetical protein AUJ24_00790 [Parcubacteria group bacterium CG1_02_36_42]|nr:MAG: hypothetical protein AUJ24_00790 [Parcubacteria group bacterium CG1_02_36_42]
MLKKSKKGFTLIELLVVIAIIALLASIVLVWLVNTRAQARDAKRFGEAGTLRTALELHYDDYGKYPVATNWIKIEEDADASGPFSQVMKPYLSQIPRDPLYPKTEDEKVFSYQYESTKDEQGYKIHIEMETGEYASYEVYTGGGGEIVYGGGGGGVLKFIKAVGGASWDYGMSAQQTLDGGYIMTGWTDSFGAGGGDALLVKLDNAHSLSWAKTVGGPNLDEPNFVRQTSDGGYIAAGYTNSFGAGSYDFLLLKFDSAGSLSWTKTVGGAGSDRAWTVQQTSDGGYIVTGSTNSFGAGGADLFLVKFDSGGNLSWARAVGGGGGDGGYFVRQTSDGGYIVTGSTNSFGAGDYDVFLVKFDSGGNLSWATTVGGVGYDRATSLQQTSDGGYIVAGETESFGAGAADFFLIKFDSGGNLSWTKTIGGTGEEQGYNVLLTTDGGYIINGLTDSFGAGSVDLLLVKFDSTGNFIWAKTAGGTNFDYSWSGTKELSDGGFLMSGYSGSFGAGGADFLLVKFDSEGNTCSGTQSISPNITSPSPTITSPSPTVTSPSPTVTSPSPTVTSPSPNDTTVCSE